MPDTITELETSTIEFASGAFDAFCEDIAGMFGISVEGTASDQQLVTLKELKSDFKKITAVFIIESKGIVNGDFYVILDQDALFTLAGTFVMLPEKVVIQNRKTGREKEANEIGDAVGEVGNLLVGAWDRYFREEMEGHVHLLQTGTFIGKPWLKPEENIGLAKETELVAVKYEMTIDPFEPVTCMVAFPKSVFEGATAEEAKEETAEEAKEEVATETEAKEEVKETAEEAKEEAATETEPKEEPAAATEEKTVEEPVEEPAAEKPVEEVTKEPAAEEKTVEEVTKEPAADPPKEEAKEETPADTATETASETVEEIPAQDRPVSTVIEQMTHSPAILPGEITGEFLTDIQAQNVMRTDIAWASQDDTVETVLTKMQQQNAGYALVGTPTAIQGIVSKSDIQGALSPYLQAVFSKWKRELDTATLQIKVRWIMSRPVHTLRPDATLSVVMETMCKHSVRALPVADENGTCGIVTTYSMFTALNAASADDADGVDQQGESTDVPALT